jgi:hypothetical protein
MGRDCTSSDVCLVLSVGLVDQHVLDLKVLCGDLVVEFVSTAFSTERSHSYFPAVISGSWEGVGLDTAACRALRGGRDVDEHVGESGRSLQLPARTQSTMIHSRSFT